MNDREFSGEALEERVIAFIRDPSADDFDSLALDIFRRQWRDNADYRKLLDLRGIRPADVRRWVDIPAVSTMAFKKLRLTCGPSNVVFRTSGTTRGSGRRGEHHLPTTRVYEAALRSSFRKHVLPDRDAIRMIALTPHPSWAPDSSLGFMVADVVERFGCLGSSFHLEPSGLSLDRLFTALEDSQKGGEPVLILGTAISMARLGSELERVGRVFRLPEGSRIMDTGGFKTETRTLTRDELNELYESKLGIPRARVVNEYGMTELCSQFYTPMLSSGDVEMYKRPHWVRTRIIDPRTGRDADWRLVPGAVADRFCEGVLLHVDLANVHSVIAVETEDLGAMDDSLGEDEFRLTGRIPGAEPRGCSRRDEETVGRLRG